MTHPVSNGTIPTGEAGTGAVAPPVVANPPFLLELMNNVALGGVAGTAFAGPIGALGGVASGAAITVFHKAMSYLWG